MAKKKPRTPPPPRKVQAPLPRTGKQGGGKSGAAAPLAASAGLTHRRLLYGAAAVGAIALVAVVLAVVLGGGSSGDKNVATLMQTAGCTFKSVKAYLPKGQPMHKDSLTGTFPWNTSPPSNGQHYPLWAVWGFYTEAVNPRQVVHNEEHGGVILWWGAKVPSSTVDQLRQFYNEESTGSFGTPYPSLGSKIAITAWTGDTANYQVNGYYGEGHIGTCPRYDAATKKAFEAFRKTYRGRGPEGIPLSADVAGMGPQSQ